MIVGTGKNSNGFRDGVIFDTGHSLTALGTDRASGRNGFGFGENRVNIFCGLDGKEVSHVRGKKMTTTVKAFTDSLSITINGVHSNKGKRLATVRTSHEFILAKIGSLINWISENKVFGGCLYGYRFMLFSHWRVDRFDG